MHLELVVPALFTAQAAQPASMRAPALELLLARGRQTDAEAASLEPWLCRSFGLEDGSLPAGALTALAYGEDAGAAKWLRADPVHLRADRDRLILVPSQAFAVTSAEAQALAGTLAPLLAGKFALFPMKPDQWCMRIEQDNESDVSAKPPLELAGADVDPNLPAKPWHPLLTEIQMALYQHPVNTAREQRGDPVINSVWLWGAGRLSQKPSGPWQSVSADDPVALGLARCAGMRHRAFGTNAGSNTGFDAGAGAAEWLARAPEDGRHLIVLEGLRVARALGDLDALERRLRELEERWFAPLLAALKAGGVGMLSVHLPEAPASFETVRGDLRRFWRRPRPLAAYGRDAA